MLEMVKGCWIDDPSILHEGYERIRTGFVANVNADKMQALFERFVLLHDDYCFIILEVPTNEKEETALTSDDTPHFHKDIYYLDGLTPERAVEFLRVFGEWFVHDGMSSFGVGIHSGANEIVRGKYNVVTIYTKSLETCHNFFEGQCIQEVTDLKTAWDYFAQDAPGESFLYEHKGKTIYDLVEHLKQYGLYFAERRSDPASV